MKLKVKRIKGGGWGILTIAIQKNYMPILQDCANGTINGKLLKQVKFTKFDYISAPILWDTPQNIPNQKEDRVPPEIFKLIECQIQVKKNIVNGYIYIAQYSWMREDPLNIEVVAPYIELGNAKEFTIIVDDSKVEVVKKPFSLRNWFKR